MSSLIQILQEGTVPRLAPGSLDIRDALHLVQGNSRESSAFSALFCARILTEVWRVWGDIENGSKWDYFHCVFWERAGRNCLLCTENKDKFSLNNFSFHYHRLWML